MNCVYNNYSLTLNNYSNKEVKQSLFFKYIKINYRNIQSKHYIYFIYKTDRK